MEGEFLSLFKGEAMRIGILHVNGMRGVIDVKFLCTSILIVGLLILFGCSNTAEKDAEVSPKFVSTGIELQGIEGKIGILGPGFVANQANKYMWHLWGSKADLNGNFKVDAINLKTGNKVNPFTLNIPMLLGGPNNGADAHLPSTMKLPEPGVWQLNAYIDEKLFGSINVEVKKL
ncbi:DUF4871 domain-containing protein [Cohnella hashimotonis]|uniref:DUF4871 domain-containing protein n=1 Tax=Cohnella hashimotonis TaxID=2826895 RepID=A0ABT6TM79_9BACL|nr:DUF4871 domain-containing protein [Cohnella hashimotonis]MDI4647910.1 DUF4871 domain-containing protein [Cohnella hashimotonis]